MSHHRFSQGFGKAQGRLIDGTPKGDILIGSNRDDTVGGGAGGDIVIGLGGNDLIDAGAGADIVLAGRGDDTVIGGAGNDLIQGGAGDDLIVATGGNDRIFGGRGLDVVQYDHGIDAARIDTSGRFFQTVTVTLMDANGRAIERDRLFGVEEVRFADATLFLDGRNNAPRAAADAAATDENAQLVLDTADLLANDSDFDGDALSLTAVEGSSVAGAAVTLSGGQILYDPGTAFDALAEGEKVTDSFRYTVDDGKGGTGTGVVTVTITGRNDAPRIAAPDAVTVAENTAGALAVVTASDVDAGDVVTLTLGGADAAVFTLDAAGALAFVTPPDFEAPADADRDNRYEIEVIATDSLGATDSRAITVTVTDVAEASVVISEIMYNPASDEDDWEWVEIVNTGATPLDLAGWVFDDINGVAQTGANIAGGTVAAGASAILFNADDLTAADFAAAWGAGINLIAVTGWGAAALNNGGDTVGLWSSFAAYEGDNTTHANAVVSVTYDDAGAWPVDDGAASIHLTDLAADANDGTNWALSVAGGETPVNTGTTANAAGGNSGADIGSPGGAFVAPVVINEIVVSTPGTDWEFVELFGQAGLDLSGVVLLEIDRNGVIDDVISFSGALGDNGFALAASPAAVAQFGVAADSSFADNTLTNNTTTFLLVDGFTGAVADDLDADDDGVLDLTPFARLLDEVALIEAEGERVYSDVAFGPDDGFLPAGVFRDPDGAGEFRLHGFDTVAEEATPTAADAGEPPAPLQLVINEVLADPATDAAGDANGDGTRDASQDEFVEIVNTGAEAADLSGLILSDAVGARHVFAPGTVLAAGAAVVVFGGGTPSGDFGGALVVTASSGALGLNNGGDTVTLAAADGTVIDSLSYGGEGGNDQSLTRAPDLSGGFVQHGAAPGANGAPYSPGTEVDGDAFGDGGGGGTGATPLLISQVQGAGAASDRVGEVVSVTAIVTGDFQNGDADGLRDLSGFFLQEEAEDQDGDAATSEGIFVFEGTGGFLTDVQVGDRVTVTGTVTEFFGKTQITASAVSIVEAGAVADTATLAQALSLDTDINGVIGSGTAFTADLEAFESMLVTFTDTLTVSEAFNLDRFNEVRLTAGPRPEQFTQFAEPDAAGYVQHLRDIAADEIIFDDGLGIQNAPIFAEADLNGDGAVTTADGFGMGDTVTNLTGVLDFDFGEYRLRTAVDGTNTFVDAQTRDIAPPSMVEDGTGRAPDITVASFNVLNFFTTLDIPGNPGSGPNALPPRGADSQAEFDRQFDRLLTALTGLDADIFGLVELENEFGGDQNGDGMVAIEAIVDGLNASFGSPVWDYVDPGRGFVDTGDAISVGMVYRTDKVTLVPGSVQILDDSVLASLPGDYGTGPVFDGADTNRAPLAASFEYDWPEGAEVFTVAVTHMKSKGGTGTGGDADALDGQGAFNETRTEGVRALADWLDPDRAGGFADADQIVLGDFNAYAQEDPIDAMIARGFTNLEAIFDPGAASFVFDGQIGTLDYAFASGAILDNVTNAAVWNINSDEPDAYDYNLDFGRDPGLFDGDVPFRSSDHDPILLGLNFTDDLLIG